MSRGKIFFGLIVALMLMMMSAAEAADDSANAKLIRIEVDTYGAEQSGALLDRISRLEKDFNGTNMTGNMNARIEAIFDTLYNNAAGPGILAKINALEWNVNHEVSSGAISNRLTALENQIAGATNTGSFNSRILALARASYGEEILPIAQVQVPAGTLIKVETVVPVSSKTLMEGDTIPVRVVEDVFVEDSLVFVKGLPGEGVVTKVVRAKHIFNNGKIETDFQTLRTIDGQSAETCAGVEAIDEMNAQSMARGLSLVGHTFSGKNKELEEVFVRGKNIDLPAGIELYVQVKTPLIVYGVRNMATQSLLVDETIKPAPIDEPSPKATIIPSEPETPKATTPSEPPKVTTIPSEPEPPKATTPSEPTPPPPSTKPSEPAPLYDDEEIIEIIDED